MRATNTNAPFNLARRTSPRAARSGQAAAKLLPVVCLLLSAFAPAARAVAIVVSTFDTSAASTSAAARATAATPTPSPPG